MNYASVPNHNNYKILPFTDEFHTSDLEIIILIILSSLVPIPPKEENNFST